MATARKTKNQALQEALKPQASESPLPPAGAKEQPSPSQPTRLTKSQALEQIFREKGVAPMPEQAAISSNNGKGPGDAPKIGQLEAAARAVLPITDEVMAFDKTFREHYRNDEANAISPQVSSVLDRFSHYNTRINENAKATLQALWDALTGEEKYTEPYNKNLDEQQAINREARRQNPTTSDVSSLVGSLGSMALLTPAGAGALHAAGGVESSVYESPAEVIGAGALGAAAGGILDKVGKWLTGLSSRASLPVAGAVGGAATEVYNNPNATLTDVAESAAKGGAAGYATQAMTPLVSELVKRVAPSSIASQASQLVSENLLKPVIPQAKWALNKFTPLAVTGMQTLLMQSFPSYIPNMGILKDLQDRQQAANVVLNNRDMDSEQKAAASERIMREGKLRYDDLGDEFYEQRGMKPDVDIAKATALKQSTISQHLPALASAKAPAKTSAAAPTASNGAPPLNSAPASMSRPFRSTAQVEQYMPGRQGP